MGICQCGVPGRRQSENGSAERPVRDDFAWKAVRDWVIEYAAFETLRRVAASAIGCPIVGRSLWRFGLAPGQTLHARLGGCHEPDSTASCLPRRLRICPRRVASAPRKSADFYSFWGALPNRPGQQQAVYRLGPPANPRRRMTLRLPARARSRPLQGSLPCRPRRRA